jgi:glutamate-5-semialdehyde dehydrogenase
MATTALSVSDTCAAAKRASRVLATLDSGTKNAALEAIAVALLSSTADILEANAHDLEAAEANGVAAHLIDRLALDAGRVAAIAAQVRDIAALEDPVGEVIGGSRLANGLDVRKVRVPLGVIAVVYEARPNVTIDAAALCLKSGNAIVLRWRESRSRPPRRPACRPA